LFNRAHEDDMERIDGAERLRVASHRSYLSVSLDGEVVAAEPPIEYRIRKGALRVIAP
jgi:diacylglycerol kinase family enzyme